MLKLAILGASGFARQIAWCAQRSGAYQVVGMVDELVSTATEVDGIVIRPQVKDIAAQHAPLHLVCGVGDPTLRQRWADEHEGQFTFATIHDPSALSAPNATLGSGSVLMPQAVLSTEATVGRHSLIGFKAVVSHEASVGSFSHLASGVILNGRSKVGNGCSIGASAVILPDVEIGDGAVIGAGAIVSKDIAAGAVVAGVRARTIRSAQS